MAPCFKTPLCSCSLLQKAARPVAKSNITPQINSTNSSLSAKSLNWEKCCELLVPLTGAGASHLWQVAATGGGDGAGKTK